MSKRKKGRGKSAGDVPPSATTNTTAARADAPTVAPAPEPSAPPDPRKARAAERARTVAPTPEPPPPILGPSEGHADKLAPHGPRLRWLALGAIVLAWVFGLSLRAAWLGSLDENPEATTFEGHRLLTTADAYYYATGVLHETTGFPTGNDRVPGLDENVLIALGGFAVSLGFAIEDVCLWMPAVIAPLIAVPLVLLGLMFGRLLWGFIASLVAVLGFSYWNRTVPGYFDTDMITIPYVFGVVALLVAAFWRRRAWLGTLAALLVILAPYMHPGSERVLAATTIGVVGYALVFTRKDPIGYRIALALLVAFLPIPFWLRAPLILVLELGLPRLRVPAPQIVYPLVTLLLFFVVAWQSRSMDVVLDILGIDLDDDGGRQRARAADLAVSFPGIGHTVAELVSPDLDKLSSRVAGHGALIVSGALGMLAMCWRHRPFLLIAPLVGLGTIFAAGGQRYTIFAVPAFALGNAWLVLLVGRMIAHVVMRHRARLVEAVAALALSPLLIGPAVAHALSYPARTAVTGPEAELLTRMKERIQPGDVMFTWWDYAYGLWYHSGARTVIDGSKQNQDTWMVAEALFTSSQREAAALARIAAETQARYQGLDSFIGDVLRDYRDKTGRPVSDFVPALREGRVELPEKTREVYLYLPWRLMQIAPNVAKLREAKGLVPDDELGRRTFLVPVQLGPDGRPLGRSPWRYDAASQQLIGARGDKVPVHTVTRVRAAGGGLRPDERVVNPQGHACVVELEHSSMRIFMDRHTYDSVLTQLMLIAKPDTRLFEPLMFARGGVIYRLKI